MILIVTHKQDFTADYIVHKLNERQIEYRRLNCEDIGDRDFKITFEKNIAMNLLGCETFDSVWFRRIKLPEISHNFSYPEKQYLLGEYYSLIQNTLTIINAKWLSYPTNVYAAENKFLQLKVALDLGFKIPSTIITNDIRELQDFYSSKRDGVVIKPLGSNKVIDGETQKIIFTNKLSDQLMSELSTYVLTPAIYQEYIPKKYEVRVTVVQNSVFSASVQSQSERETEIDWRRKRLPFQPYELPPEISDQCVKLVHALGLEFGAIDLIRSTDGLYYFLEINPNGQWVWIETETKLPISDAIINFLK